MQLAVVLASFLSICPAQSRETQYQIF
jgi:hypothetical protein